MTNRSATRRVPSDGGVWARIVTIVLACFAGSCSLPPDNKKLVEEPTADPIVWRLDPTCLNDFSKTVERPGCADETQTDFIAVGLSGGGTKATVFSGETLFYLQALGLLQRTSLISAVSGGSFAAALYALSCDEQDARCISERPHGDSRPIWRYQETMRTLGQGNRPLIWEQVFRLAVPLVSQTISAHAFGKYIDQRFLHPGQSAREPFTFGDLNRRRPPLYLNATIISENRTGLDDVSDNDSCQWNDSSARQFLRRRTPDEFFHFSFSQQYFKFINSDLQKYPLGAAVAASAAFPALIEPALLHDYCKVKGPSTVRLIDGGANDNQALIELYVTLSELIYGQKRSSSWQDAHRLIGQHGDRAFVFLVNSSVTETTGQPGTKPGQPPHEIVSFVIDLFDRITAATDTYSAVGFNLRKQLYLRELGYLHDREENRRKAGLTPLYAPLLPVEISLTELDQYAVGGTEAALRVKSHIDVQADGSFGPDAGREASDPAQSLVAGRIKRQAKVYKQLVDHADIRRRLRLSNWHPQCYFDIRAALDKSLSELSSRDQACVREAARWSVALRAQEMCNSGASGAPRGLDCHDGAVNLQGDPFAGSRADVDLANDGQCDMRDYRTEDGNSVVHVASGEDVKEMMPNLKDVQCRDLSVMGGG